MTERTGFKPKKKIVNHFIIKHLTKQSEGKKTL
jgi:hypothetical protein